MALLLVSMPESAGASSRQNPPSDDQYGPNRVTVCHRTSAKPQKWVTLVVSRSSLPAHLRHGDTLGPCVYGAVTANGKVSLSWGNGKRVASLVSKRLYSIVVRDPSRSENFHIFGSGVERSTTASFVGTVRWKVTFKRAVYRYQSDAHPGLRRLLAVR
jgi:hypothetical protein